MENCRRDRDHSRRPIESCGTTALMREFYEIDQHEWHEGAVCTALAPLLADDQVGQVHLVAPNGLGSVVVGYAIITWGYSIESGGRECLLDELFLCERGTGLGGLVLEGCPSPFPGDGAAQQPC